MRIAWLLPLVLLGLSACVNENSTSHPHHRRPARHAGTCRHSTGQPGDDRYHPPVT